MYTFPPHTDEDEVDDETIFGFSPNEIAGLVAGFVVLILVLLTLLILLCVCLILWRRRREGRGGHNIEKSFLNSYSE